MGMTRPDLAGLLHDKAAEVGVKLRYATTTTDLTQDEDGVERAREREGDVGIVEIDVPHPAAR